MYFWHITVMVFHRISSYFNRHPSRSKIQPQQFCKIISTKIQHPSYLLLTISRTFQSTNFDVDHLWLTKPPTSYPIILLELPRKILIQKVTIQHQLPDYIDNHNDSILYCKCYCKCVGCTSLPWKDSKRKFLVCLKNIGIN